MYALAVNGSPRKEGNTSILVKKVLEPLNDAGWETEYVQLGGKRIKGCIACYKCFENKDKRCAVDNDIFNEIMEKMIRADAIILGSPTYFASVSAEIKALMDRSGLVSLANDELFAGKIGSAVVAQRRGGATNVFDTINKMYQMSQMILPGSTYWNFGVGRNPGEVEDDAEGLANMVQLGKTIAWLGAAMAPHQESFPVLKRLQTD